jgi:hypothetical protein
MSESDMEAELDRIESGQSESGSHDPK